MTESRLTSLDLKLSEDELDATRDLIVSFIREQMDEANLDRAVLGISGGIDSALTAYLGVAAIGAENLHGLVLPGEVNTDENMSDAERVGLELGIPLDVIEIEPIAEAVYAAYPEGRDDRVAAGNVRVRIRGVLNYFVANHENAVVLGTGNRTESLVGYFTKYGDGAVDCLPIGNLYKQQVRQLARHIGVPEDIVTKTPTAGLWVGQTDEEELGFTYDVLDLILALAIDGPFSPSTTASFIDGVTVNDVRRVQELHSQSAHKRAVPPAPAPIQFD